MARGPWGPLGPRCRMHVESVTTYYQASYLLSGRLSAVSEMHTKGIDMHPRVSAYFAPNNRIHAPNRSIDMHPKAAYMWLKLIP